MARSPIPQLIEDFHQMTPEEQRCFLDLVDPQPEPAKQKRGKKPGSAKSKRAAGMAEAIKNSLQASQAAAPNTPDESNGETAKCGICGNVRDHSDHDRNYIKSHDFEAPKSVARAGRKSSRKGSETKSEASTASEGDAAIAVGGSGD